MQIKFLGTGGAFDVEYGNSAAWLTFHEKTILLDCGNTTYARIREKGLVDQIDYILITHLHDDHAGSLASLVLHHNYFLDPPRKPVILYPTAAFRDKLYDFLSFSLVRPELYVDFQPLDTLAGIEVIDTTGHHIEGMPSFGFCFQEKKESIVYSGDVGSPGLVFDFLKTHSASQVRVFHELSFWPTKGVHTYYKEIMPYFPEFDIYGYHIDPRKEPVDNTIPLVANFPELLI